jgi:signal transduction histidine kinase
MLTLCNLAALTSLILRQRQAKGEERQQIKWLIIPAFVFFASIPFTISGLVGANPQILNIAIALVLFSVPAMVIAVALAIFRYRLYDIDIIVNRTLVYGGLTAGLAGLYVFSVGATGVALQQGSQWASLLLTLGLAAILYRPLRGRVQQGVDRLVSPTQVQAVAGSLEGEAGSERLEEQPIAEYGRWFKLARAGWVLLAVVAVVLLLLAIPGLRVRQPMGNLGDHLVYDPTPFMLAVNRLNLAGSFLAVLLSCGLAALLFVKRKNDPMALFTAYFLIIHGLLFGGVVELLEPFWPEAAAVNSFILLPLIYFPLIMILLAIFPDGRFVPPWTRWLLPMMILLAPITASLTYSGRQSFSEPLSNPLIIGAYAGWILIVLALVRGQIYRYRNVSTRQQRQQTKWVVYSFLVMIGLFALGSGPWSYALSLPAGTTMPWWLPPVESTWIIALAILPITLTVSITRYRLYEIDLLINRTLVYGGLTAAVVGLYVLVVGALSTLFQAQENLFIALVATGLVAVLFQPLRQRLQRWANRVVYGDRDEPFEALARLGRRLEGTFSPEMVYPTIVETVAQTLKLPYAAIAVKRGEEFEVAEAHGSKDRGPVVYPLTHQGEVIGQLLVGRRTPGEEFSPADERILRNFARQAGTAIHAVQLTADLQLSRQQLVTTRAEERLRLRRDLHDGLGPALASVIWQADSARDLVYKDPSEAVQLLEGSIEQAQAALADIRRLVYGLRPPALDELGLVGALDQAAQKHQQTEVTIEAPARLSSLPAAVEVAAYRIVQEAIKNAVEHGKAQKCAVYLALDGNLCLTVKDDGLGLPEAVTSGVGLVSMRERAEELGGTFKIHPRPVGGTVVEIRLPLEVGG